MMDTASIGLTFVQIQTTDPDSVSFCKSQTRTKASSGLLNRGYTVGVWIRRVGVVVTKWDSVEYLQGTLRPVSAHLSAL
jgi:hypothetical protein